MNRTSSLSILASQGVDVDEDGLKGANPDGPNSPLQEIDGDGLPIRCGSIVVDFGGAGGPASVCSIGQGQRLQAGETVIIFSGKGVREAMQPFCGRLGERRDPVATPVDAFQLGFPEEFHDLAELVQACQGSVVQGGFQLGLMGQFHHQECHHSR